MYDAVLRILKNTNLTPMIYSHGHNFNQCAKIFCGEEVSIFMSTSPQRYGDRK